MGCSGSRGETSVAVTIFQSREWARRYAARNVSNALRTDRSHLRLLTICCALDRSLLCVRRLTGPQFFDDSIIFAANSVASVPAIPMLAGTRKTGSALLVSAGGAAETIKRYNRRAHGRRSRDPGRSRHHSVLSPTGQPRKKETVKWVSL